MNSWPRPSRPTTGYFRAGGGGGKREFGPRAFVRTAGDGKIVRHVLRVDVLGPEGALRTYYSRNLDTTAGKAEMTIPLALNDATGTWRLRVKDVATGTMAEKTFKVK